MKCLQSKIAATGRVPSNLTLLICLLFVTFEFQQRGYGEAHSHLNGGLNIIREYEEGLDSSSAPTQDDIDPLIEAFERLDIQMASFTSGEVYLKRSTQGTRILPSKLEHFENVSDAMRQLNFQLGTMRDLDFEVDQLRFSEGGITPYDYPRLHGRIMRQLAHLRQFQLSMDDLQRRVSTHNDRVAMNILQIRCIYCKLKVSNCLTDGRECLWDKYLLEFEQIIGTAENVASLQRSDAAGYPKTPFCLDTGIIPPVYYTVVKCRDPYLRRRALAVLRDCRQQEGAWSGAIAARMADNIMTVEEQGIPYVNSAADIPEISRLYQAFYDLRYSEKLIYCKRRRFEADGAWLDFEISVG